jgi:hypothetical protein
MWHKDVTGECATSTLQETVTHNTIELVDQFAYDYLAANPYLGESERAKQARATHRRMVAERSVGIGGTIVFAGVLALIIRRQRRNGRHKASSASSD